MSSGLRWTWAHNLSCCRASQFTCRHCGGIWSEGLCEVGFRRYTGVWWRLKRACSGHKLGVMLNEQSIWRNLAGSDRTYPQYLSRHNQQLWSVSEVQKPRNVAHSILYEFEHFLHFVTTGGRKRWELRDCWRLSSPSRSLCMSANMQDSRWFSNFGSCPLESYRFGWG